MDCYLLGDVSWQHSQLLYHAAAHLGKEALIILRPSSAYICLGYHQDAHQEINLDYANNTGIPVFRREVGGGAVYLDQGQLFYQMIFRKNNPCVPGNKMDFYKKFLQPVVDTYCDLGIPAEFRPVNDIVTNGRKISGNGAAEINNMVVLVGNFILDFNYKMMSRVLPIPDEKFRDKIYKTLQENLTTIKRERGQIPEISDLTQRLVSRLEPLVGSVKFYTQAGEDLLKMADQLADEMLTPEWLMANDIRKPPITQIKIREGVSMINRTVKLPGGLVRISAVNQDNHIHDIHISGDFFLFPQESLPDLENSLEGVPYQVEKIEQVLLNYFQLHAIQAPGISPSELARIFQ
jgi:lipoate-protein ligase A